jgi:hypothetical protein
VLIFTVGCGKEIPEGSADSTAAGQLQQRSRLELQYALLQTELRLAQSDSLYFVIHFPRRELQFKLKGAVVWDYPLNFADEDSSEIAEFIRKFSADQNHWVRSLTGKYLFASVDKNPDSVLTIVSGVLKVQPDLLQREVPERFQLRWGSGLILDVSTDVVGKPKSKLKNAMIQVTQVLQRPFGEAHIALKMDPQSAVTFYRAARDGLPTLLIPPAVALP